MLIEIVGVVDDGARPLSDVVPRDARQAIQLRQGETTIVRVTLVSAAGAPLRMTGSDHLAMTVRAQSGSPGPGKRLFVKTSAAAAKRPANVYDIVISSEDTRGLQVTRCIYDVFAVRSSGRYVAVPTSELVIARSTADVANLP